MEHLKIHLSHFAIVLTLFSFAGWTASCELRIVTEDLPPYQIVENGVLKGGSAAQQVRQALARAKIECPIEVLPWARAYHIATSESNVLIFSMIRSNNRESKFHWLGKLSEEQYRLYSVNPVYEPASADSWPTIRAYKKAVVVRGSFEASWLMSIGFIEGENLVLVKDAHAMWSMVLQRKVDFTMASVLPTDHDLPVTTLLPSAVVTRRELYVALSRPSTDQLLQRLQAAFSYKQ